MLRKYNSFYIIGIGGISLSAIAKILLSQGKIVYGSDVSRSSLIDELCKLGIEVVIGNAPEFVDKSQAIIITGAISESNPDLVYAKGLGRPIYTRAEVLAEIANDKTLVSVAGTHGKTTTTGMLSCILLEEGVDPTIHIGGILNNISSNLKIGKGEIFVTEACEYKDSFLSLNSNISIVLNVQEDHLDYFKNLDNIFHSFNKFVQNTKKNGTIIYNYDELNGKLCLNRNSISFGLSDGADIRAEEIIEYQSGKFQFDLIVYGQKATTIILPCYGFHNIKNALAAATAALKLGVRVQSVKNGLEGFKGIKRRNEIIVEKDNHIIIHDYAHHPTEIEASLKSYRNIVKDGKLICIFQPHTFSRTRDLFDDFVKCFNACDEVWFIPIYPAREEPIEGITSRALADKISSNGQVCKCFDDFLSCKTEIIDNINTTDMFAILGAGDIEKLAYSLRTEF